MSWIMMFCNIIVILVQNVGPLFFAAGLVLAFIYWITFMLIAPAIEIRKEMRDGKTFKQAWHTVFKNNGSFTPTIGAPNQISNSAPSYRYDALSDAVGNPAYSSIPGNISYRR